MTIIYIGDFFRCNAVLAGLKNSFSPSRNIKSTNLAVHQPAGLSESFGFYSFCYKK